jgi:hypothetical protein
MYGLAKIHVNSTYSFFDEFTKKLCNYTHLALGHWRMALSLAKSALISKKELIWHVQVHSPVGPKNAFLHNGTFIQYTYFCHIHTNFGQSSFCL